MRDDAGLLATDLNKTLSYIYRWWLFRGLSDLWRHAGSSEFDF